MILSKAFKKISVDVLEEIFEQGKDDPASLHRVVSASEVAIAKATKERDANAEYKKAGEVRKDFTDSLNEVKMFQRAKAAVALALLDESSISPEDDEALEKARAAVYQEQKARKKAG